MRKEEMRKTERDNLKDLTSHTHTHTYKDNLPRPTRLWLGPGRTLWKTEDELCATLSTPSHSQEEKWSLLLTYNSKYW